MSDQPDREDVQDTIEDAPGPFFELVRRGYNPDQVHQYVATPQHLQSPRPNFTLQRRGYNAAQVDEYVAYLHPPQDAAPQTP